MRIMAVLDPGGSLVVTLPVGISSVAAASLALVLALMLAILILVRMAKFARKNSHEALRGGNDNRLST
jgi:hypothetical protein